MMNGYFEFSTGLIQPVYIHLPWQRVAWVPLVIKLRIIAIIGQVRAQQKFAWN